MAARQESGAGSLPLSQPVAGSGQVGWDADREIGQPLDEVEKI